MSAKRGIKRIVKGRWDGDVKTSTHKEDGKRKINEE